MQTEIRGLGVYVGSGVVGKTFTVKKVAADPIEERQGEEVGHHVLRLPRS